MLSLINSVKNTISRIKSKVLASSFKFKKLFYRINHRLGSSSSDFIGFDKYSLIGAYHWNEIKYNLYYKRKAEYVCVQCATNSVIADFGCGDGAILGFLASNYPDKEFIGIEADRKACKLAKQMLRENNLYNAKLIASPFGALQGLDKQVELAYSMDVIEHLPNPEVMLEKMSAILKPRGIAVIGTPLFIRDDLVSPYHVHEFEAKELERLIGRYFDLVETTYLSEMRTDGKEYADNFCIVRAMKRES